MISNLSVKATPHISPTLQLLERKFGFLQKVLNADLKCVSGKLVELEAMCDSISSLRLVRECKEFAAVRCDASAMSVVHPAHA